MNFLNGAAQTFWIIATVKVLAGDIGVGHRRRRHEVFQSNLIGLALDGPGDGVDDQFHDKANPGPRDAPVRQDRRFVGGYGVGFTMIGRDDVGAGQDTDHLGAFQAGGKRVGRIRARIDRCFRFKAKNLPARIGIGGHVVVVFAAIGIGGQMFPAVLDPAYRMAAVHREPAETDLFWRQNPLVAEAAAHIRRDNSNLGLIETQAFGKARTNDMGHLRRGVDNQLLQAAIPISNGALSFKRRHALPVGSKFLGHRHRRGCLSLGQIPIKA